MVTIRETILAYPGLEDCEVFLDKVVFPGRELTGEEVSSTIDTNTQKLII